MAEMCCLKEHTLDIYTMYFLIFRCISIAQDISLVGHTVAR